MSETKTWAQVMREAIDARLLEVNTSMPGLIVSFDPGTGLAVVQPSFKRKFNYEKEAVTLPQITNVPVVFPRGGGASIVFDLQKDDPVLLIFAQRSMDAWISSGGIVDPKDPRKHGISDAVAYPGLYDKTKPASADKIQIEFKKDGSITQKNEKGNFSLDKDGGFKFENEGGNFGFSKEGKFSTLGNSASLDFFTQLLLVIDKLVETTTVATSIGPQPFIPDPGYLSERAKLDDFIG